MKRHITGIASVAVLLAGTAFAAPTHPTFGTFVNSSAVPNGAKLVLNITYQVANDEDSGFVGYWALDNYNKHVQVWQDPGDPTLFYAVARYAGTWTTFKGALSPGAGVVQASGGSGTFEGGWVGTFHATGVTPASGNIGGFDFGGTKADILLGTYGNGQTGDTGFVYDWIGANFQGYANDLNQTQWGWTYHYRGQAWNNFYYGSPATDGDILTNSKK